MSDVIEYVQKNQNKYTHEGRRNTAWTFDRPGHEDGRSCVVYGVYR